MPILTRRSIIARSLLGLTAAATVPYWRRASADDDPALRLAELEARKNGRLGVAVLETRTRGRIAHRGDERFAMCSTFKFLAAGFVLFRVDRGAERLDRRVAVAEQDLVPYSPVTKRHAGKDAMTMAELCHAAVTFSDNTAGNLLLTSFGGPAGLTGFTRALGDPVSRLDRMEIALNEAAAGDPRDTTTPAAMLGNMERLLLGDGLSPASREQLTEWLIGNQTGGGRLRAGIPDRWRVGDRTGTGQNAATNVVAITWPPDSPPILIAVYYAESGNTPEGCNAVVAEDPDRRRGPGICAA